MLHTLRFSLQNAIYFIMLPFFFGSCIIHILHTECAKILMLNSGAKRLNSQLLIPYKQYFSKLCFFFSALRYSTNDGEFKDNALRLTNSLINIRLEYLLLRMLVLIWKSFHSFAY